MTHRVNKYYLSTYHDPAMKSGVGIVALAVKVASVIQTANAIMVRRKEKTQSNCLMLSFNATILKIVLILQNVAIILFCAFLFLQNFSINFKNSFSEFQYIL